MTHMNATRPSARRSRRRRVLIVLGLLLLAGTGVFVGALTYRHLANERLLREAIAEVEALDPHWRLEAIEANRAAVPDDENAAIVIQHAASLRGQSAAARRWELWRGH